MAARSTQAVVPALAEEIHLTALMICGYSKSDRGVISLANHVANKWCGGVSLATVPLDLAAVIVSSITPRALDTDAEHQRLVATKPCARSAFADLEDYGPLRRQCKVAQCTWLQHLCLITRRKVWPHLG